MRNDLFPRRVADYLTAAQAKDIKARNVTVERDFQFGMDEPAPSRAEKSTFELTAAQLRASKPAPKTVEVEKLTVRVERTLSTFVVFSRLNWKNPLTES